MNIRFTLLVFLSGIILTIILFSVIDRGITTKYVFSDNLKIDNTNQKDTIIGTLELDSKKFFPEKLELHKLKACIFNPNSKFTYNVYYSKNKDNFIKTTNIRGANIIDVPALTLTKLSIKITLEFPIIKDNLERGLYYSQIPPTNILYIYESDNINFTGSYLEFCENVNKEDAKYMVNVIN